MIAGNLTEIKERIKKAAENSPQTDKDVTLVAVSKTFPSSSIREAYQAGQKIFGENKVQEALDKIDECKDLPAVEFHMIGHLQSNKVKYIPGVFKLIHSVDRKSLVKEMHKRFHRDGVYQDILVQVNLALEEQKGGVIPEKLDDLLEYILQCNSLNLRGFMLMPPFRENPEDNRYLFAKMYELFGRYKDQFEKSDIKHFDTLSMGMSADFETAVEEGSNMVRVGSKIFGKRNL
ncbi:MAG: YggS family pyridoxal phosphate-dependent enzyme [Flexistipes sinusarabici]|uniref:Pyridoxal phosphate homeostasis protein n=1 Tax=Flexistipes sinusarabici TaxID=2352 RepID=A0A5D0MSX7_FLESI|nr:YggS family pyridoxal phosphate-dependent enzyme [Flexistipes sinusarabici]TYB34489.1 MAG: YggS family pyridoxal phosphate-dependent enzyme [Flexistipes sinusarabici]